MDIDLIIQQAKKGCNYKKAHENLGLSYLNMLEIIKDNGYKDYREIQSKYVKEDREKQLCDEIIELIKKGYHAYQIRKIKKIGTKTLSKLFEKQTGKTFRKYKNSINYQLEKYFDDILEQAKNNKSMREAVENVDITEHKFRKAVKEMGFYSWNDCKKVMRGEWFKKELVCTSIINNQTQVLWTSID